VTVALPAPGHDASRARTNPGGQAKAPGHDHGVGFSEGRHDEGQAPNAAAAAAAGVARPTDDAQAKGQRARRTCRPWRWPRRSTAPPTTSAGPRRVRGRRRGTPTRPPPPTATGAPAPTPCSIGTAPALLLLSRLLRHAAAASHASTAQRSANTVGC